MKRAATFLIVLLFSAGAAMAQKQITVAQDGSGDYKTVQEAINAVPDQQSTETVIHIKKGTYHEKLLLPATKTNVTMIGDDNKTTILTYDDYASKQDNAGKNIGTSGSASFHIYGANFTAINIGFENSSGPVGQAVAVWVAGDHAHFKNCRFLGCQDTLYTFGANTVELYEDCYIEGTVDFIFGAATAWFNRCTLYCIKGGGYLTAASTPDSVKYGYVFYQCKITGEAPEGSFELGRPWRPYAKVLFAECELGEQIKPNGWSDWGKEANQQTAFYAEYKNNGPGYSPDTRVSWSHQLTAKEFAEYTKDKVLKGWKVK